MPWVRAYLPEGLENVRQFGVLALALEQKLKCCWRLSVAEVVEELFATVVEVLFH